MKLVGNFYIMSMMELIGEGLTLADKNGLQRDAVVHFLKESFQGPITGGKFCAFRPCFCIYLTSDALKTSLI